MNPVAGRRIASLRGHLFDAMFAVCALRKRVRRGITGCLMLCTSGWPGHALGHGFGEGFALTIPVWLWLTGAALSLALSFAAVIDFVPRTLERVDYPVFRLVVVHGLARSAARWLLALVRVALLVVLALTIAAGLFGTPEPGRNLAPTMFWVVFWVGTAFLSAVLGGFWTHWNPLCALYDGAAFLWSRISTRPFGFERAFPAWLEAWPAVLLMLVFAWGEHVWSQAALPFALGVALLAYIFLSLAGMLVFGRDRWLEHGEIFSIVFSLFARVAPFETRRSNEPGVATRALYLRVPGSGLLALDVASRAMTVFIVLILALTSFDGLITTPAWSAFAEQVTAAGLPAPLVGTGLTTLAMIALPALFLLACRACAACMRYLGAPTGRGQDTGELVRRFVPTLIPIAVAYHVAHYVTLLVGDGPRVVSLLSDPLGRGWNLLGTATWSPELAALEARTWWAMVVGVVVAGHVLAVYLAHIVALDVFKNRRRAILCEIPMVLLMIVYTVSSLWIMAQPSTG